MADHPSLRLPEAAQRWADGIPRAYAQVFFSDHRGFGLALVAISFLDPAVGLSGLAAVVLAQVLARVAGFDRLGCPDGLLTYNPLMVGWVLGVYFRLTPSFWVLHAVAVLLTLLLAVWLRGRLAARGLPFLSLPFLLATWALLLGARKFSALTLKARELASAAGPSAEGRDPGALASALTAAQESLQEALHSGFLEIYFKSLGAIAFQYNLLAGMALALALAAVSRISLVYSLVGYTVGYGFYRWMEGDFSQLVYSYIGFNYLLTAIALGGFFVVAGRASLLLVAGLIPVIALLISALDTVFAAWSLPLYALPFNLVVLLTLSALGMRAVAGAPALVTEQRFRPEANLYRHRARQRRFGKDPGLALTLPVLGRWFVSQGHEGRPTHRGAWRHAWDLDVRGDDGRTWREPGASPADYHCHGLPVTAPADGWVVAAEDGIPDNAIGAVDLEHNWGNTLVLQHSPYCFSQLSHLLEGSLAVRPGAFVRRGEVLARCGSSGRSPEPHLHLQFQATGQVGARTLDLPLAHYLSWEGDTPRLRLLSVPRHGETVSTVKADAVLREAFTWAPGRRWTVRGWAWRAADGSGPSAEGPRRAADRTETWVADTDAWNNPHLYRAEDRAALWYAFDGALFTALNYTGPRRGLLYRFYLAAQRLVLGRYPGLEAGDRPSPEGLFPRPWLWLQELLVPAGFFLDARYASRLRPGRAEGVAAIYDVEGEGRAFGRRLGARRFAFGLGAEGPAWLLDRGRRGGAAPDASPRPGDWWLAWADAPRAEGYADAGPDAREAVPPPEDGPSAEGRRPPAVPRAGLLALALTLLPAALAAQPGPWPEGGYPAERAWLDSLEAGAHWPELLAAAAALERRGPAYPDLPLRQARAAWELGRGPTVERAAARALTLDPASASARWWAALGAAASGRADDALAARAALSPAQRAAWPEPARRPLASVTLGAGWAGAARADDPDAPDPGGLAFGELTLGHRFGAWTLHSGYQYGRRAPWWGTVDQHLGLLRAAWTPAPGWGWAASAQGFGSASAVASASRTTTVERQPAVFPPGAERVTETTASDGRTGSVPEIGAALWTGAERRTARWTMGLEAGAWGYRRRPELRVDNAERTLVQVLSPGGAVLFEQAVDTAWSTVEDSAYGHRYGQLGAHLAFTPAAGADRWTLRLAGWVQAFDPLGGWPFGSRGAGAAPPPEWALEAGLAFGRRPAAAGPDRPARWRAEARFRTTGAALRGRSATPAAPGVNLIEDAGLWLDNQPDPLLWRASLLLDARLAPRWTLGAGLRQERRRAAFSGALYQRPMAHLGLTFLP